MSTLRERIAEAAQELYLRDGIEGFSMRKLADMVGVSAPAIYRHYPNKDALLNEVVVEGLKAFEAYLRPALGEATPYERLVRLTEGYLAFALEQPKYFDFAFLTPDRSIRGLADEVSRPIWNTFRLSIDQVGGCMRDGVFEQDDPLEVAVTIWAEAHGLVTLFRHGRFGPDAEAFKEIYRKSLRRLMRGLEARGPATGPPDTEP